MTIGRKIWLCMTWLLAVAIVASTSAGAQPPEGLVTVMTQNMNMGNIETLRIGTPEAVALFFKETVATNPKDRAAAIAKEIRANQPDLVALQEVSILRKGSGPTPNDPRIPATEVVHDQLQLLREALTTLGEHYDTVAVIPNSEVQFPSTLNFVVRLTDRTIILARASSNRLKLSNVQVEEYRATPPVPPAASGFIIPMFGWGSVDVEVGDWKFRFVATHLTPAALDQPLIAIQKAQALELIQSAGKPDLPGGSVLPVVYAGDFNTVAGLDTYKILVDNSGRIDAWQKKNPMASCPEGHPQEDRRGCTAIQDPDLRNPTSKLSHRIDLVIVPPDTNIAEIRLIGADPADRTPSGLWPSDHAGVVASFLPQRNSTQETLTNVQTGKCLTIAGGVSTDNNVGAVQFTCDGHPSRTWKLNSVGGEFQIQNLETGKCLTIAGGVSTENNVEAVQFTCDSHPSRTWKINNVGGVFQIQNVQTGKCLTIAGGVSTDNNVGAVQFTCDSHPSRTWQVNKVETDVHVPTPSQITPRRISLRSINFRDRFLRHKNFLAELEPIGSDLDKADATFIMTPGLNGMGGNSVSFASVNFPGFWLRQQDLRLKLQKEPVRVDELGIPRPLPPDTPELKQFHQDATFLMSSFELGIPSIGGVLANGITNSQRISTVQVFFIPQTGRNNPLPMRHRDFHILMEVTDREHVADQQWEIVDGLSPAPPVEPH